VAVEVKVRRALFSWHTKKCAKSAPKVWQIFRCFDSLSKAPRRLDFVSGLRFAVGPIVVALGPKVRGALFLC
jgi:hypothetical protein